MIYTVVLMALLAIAETGFAQRAPEPAIVPFKIQVPESVLTDLKRRLSQARFADEFPDAGWGLRHESGVSQEPRRILA
jgi:hypothetical protein